MNVIHPVATGAYLYYDAHGIRGVSFTDNETPHDKLIIPLDMAAKFISGEFAPHDWMIWTTAAGPAVYKLRGNKLALDIADEFAPIENEVSPISLTIKLYRKAQRVIFRVNSTVAVDTTMATLPFLFTDQRDPSAVLHALDVPTETLLTTKLVNLPLPVDPAVPLTVYTRRLFPGCQIENMTDDADLILLLPPGHFVDLMRFERATIQQGLQAVLRPAERVLRFTLRGDGVETYDRCMPFLWLLFSMPDDPSLLLHTARIAVEDLRDGVTLQLPEILDRPFDLWAPLLYRSAAISEIES